MVFNSLCYLSVKEFHMMQIFSIKICYNSDSICYCLGPFYVCCLLYLSKKTNPMCVIILSKKLIILVNRTSKTGLQINVHMVKELTWSILIVNEFDCEDICSRLFEINWKCFFVWYNDKNSSNESLLVDDDDGGVSSV